MNKCVPGMHGLLRSQSEAKYGKATVGDSCQIGAFLYVCPINKCVPVVGAFPSYSRWCAPGSEAITLHFRSKSPFHYFSLVALASRFEARILIIQLVLHAA